MRLAGDDPSAYLPMDSDEAHILLNTWQVEDPSSGPNCCQRHIRIIEGIALDPEPSLGEAQTPVLLRVGWCILEVIALATPF